MLPQALGRGGSVHGTSGDPSGPLRPYPAVNVPTIPAALCPGKLQ